MTRPLRVLMTSDAVGGVWQYATDLARVLAQDGVETALALLGPPPTSAQREAAADLTLIDTGLPLDWLAPDRDAVCRAGAAVAALGNDCGADVIHLNTPALAAVADFGAPVIAVSHSCLATWWEAVQGGSPDGDFAWRSELHGLALRAADLVVTPTAAFGTATQRVHKLPRAPATVHNGRARLPLPAAASHDFAFTAGRLWDRAKDPDTLDRVAGRLAIPFYAAGPVAGPHGESVDFRHARPLGSLSEAELAHHLAAKPVFVSTAVYEPFGLAVLEAAAAGCPLVLADIPSFRELWDGAALFVPPRDAGAFADAIADIAGDTFRREAMGAAARTRAERYTPRAAAAAMTGLYRVASAGAARAAA